MVEGWNIGRGPVPPSKDHPIVERESLLSTASRRTVIKHLAEVRDGAVIVALLLVGVAPVDVTACIVRIERMAGP